MWEFAYEIFLSLDYLNKNNIVHRDIKCLNIFLDKNNFIKLGDLDNFKIVKFKEK